MIETSHLILKEKAITDFSNSCGLITIRSQFEDFREYDQVQTTSASKMKYIWNAGFPRDLNMWDTFIYNYKHTPLQNEIYI